MSRLFVALQFLLPRHWLTAIVHRVARIRVRWVKDALIRGFIRIYKVDLAEIAAEVPRDYRHFNDFFIRELAPGARPIAADPRAIVSPVDGTVSMAGTLNGDRLLQAKGIDYTLDDLLVIDLDAARAFDDGLFATIYLAPYNYHRVHMPVDGELVAAHYIPGDLFSVNDRTAAHVNGLFRRNERLNLHFRTAHGPGALIFVGALNVGSITTPWTGEIRPRKRGVAEPQKLRRAPRSLARGDLLGWFNMGSTVIVLLPRGAADWHPALTGGSTLRMGQAIGQLRDGST
ncbi:MAG: archaetidylserine decarboxylase [Woeseiaceae bacterium]|nr:archaetidylserine decarboxylase [Woeseiaceae bacterium]